MKVINLLIYSGVRCLSFLIEIVEVTKQNQCEIHAEKRRMCTIRKFMEKEEIGNTGKQEIDSTQKVEPGKSKTTFMLNVFNLILTQKYLHYTEVNGTDTPSYPYTASLLLP